MINDKEGNGDFLVRIRVVGAIDSGIAEELNLFHKKLLKMNSTVTFSSTLEKILREGLRGVKKERGKI